VSRRVGVSTAIAALALLTGAGGCGGGGGGGNSSSDGLVRLTTLPRAKGTLLGRLSEALPRRSPGGGVVGIVVAAGKDRRGRPVKPAARFTPANARQIAVVVRVGALRRPGRLAVEWYSIDGAGRERRLHESHVSVSGHQWAWSIGRAPAPVATGLYEAVAHVAGSELATWFSVGSERPPAVSQQAAGGAPELVSADEGGALWDAWSEGTAGPQQPPGGASSGECFLWTHGGEDGIAAFAFTVPVAAGADCTQDATATATVGAAVSGEPTDLASGEAAKHSVARTEVDPCTLPGGSDLPGTVVHVLGKDGRGHTATAEVQLADLSPGPIVAGESTPPDGSRVNPGDKITLHFGAGELPFAKGIHKVEFFANGAPLREWSAGDTPKACDKERFMSEFGGHYTVPADPPPVVELVVRAEDYDSHFGWQTWEFPTRGATWRGTVTARLEQEVPAGMQESDAQLAATLSEDPNGNVTGVLVGEQSQELHLSNCPSTTHSPGRIRAEVSGTFKDDVLSLELGAVDFSKPGVTPCPFGPPAVMGSLIDALYAPLGKALASITKEGDGRYHAEAKGTSGHVYKYTVRYTIVLKRKD
jgi:hypothetical protein